MPGAYAATFVQPHSVFTFRFQPVNGVSFAALSCACGYGPISAMAEAGSFHIPLFHGKGGDSFRGCGSGAITTNAASRAWRPCGHDLQ